MEGFVRRLIGWRDYVWHLYWHFGYWHFGPEYRHRSAAALNGLLTAGEVPGEEG